MAICGGPTHWIPHTPGTLGNCYECAQEIFISQTTINACKEKDLDIRAYCLECGQRVWKRDKPPIYELTEEQKNEILHGLSKL